MRQVVLSRGRLQTLRMVWLSLLCLFPYKQLRLPNNLLDVSDEYVAIHIRYPHHVIIMLGIVMSSSTERL